MRFKSLGVFALTMITISAVLNLRGIPLIASLGIWSVFYYLLGALCFLIPSTLICLALSKQFPESGGIYIWVQKSLGPSWGFLAIWMEWINNLVSTPATLASLVGTLGFISFGKTPLFSFFNNTPTHLFFTLFFIYLFLTWLNSLNIATSSKLNTLGALLGTLIPGFLIMGLALSFIFFSPNSHSIFLSSALSNSLSSLTSFSFTQIHSFSYSNFSLFLSVLSAYSGMQITAFHFQNIRNPHQTLPKALILSCALILLISMGTALALSSITPSSSIQVITGVMQSFQAFFNFFHLGFLTSFLAMALAIGSLASMSAWIIGPARGLFQFADAQDQNSHHTYQLPRLLKKINHHEMPTGILLIQLVIGTILLSVYLWMPSVTQAFWFLIVITSQFTLLMFALVFISALKIIKAFTIKLLAALGLVTVLIGFALGLIPPEILKIQNNLIYISEIIFTDCLILGLPLLFLSLQKKKITKLLNKPDEYKRDEYKIRPSTYS